MSTTPATAAPAAASRPEPKGYVPAVGSRLKKLLFVVFALVAILGANSLYLVSITVQEWLTGFTYQNYFYQYMFLAHLALGILLLVPFLAFGFIHLFTARTRRNKRAVRVGYALFITSIILLATGVALMRVGSFDLKQKLARDGVYWLHVLAPLAAGWLYWLHRLAGPAIKWRYGISYGAVVGVVVAGMVGLHSQDPRQWNVVGSKEGKKYFEPSLVGTPQGNFIPAQTLMMDSYCLKCHGDAYQGWYHSAHHFSSFNNPAYLPAVEETRKVALERDGNVKASRWCAGCHDPVPFLAGEFDDAKYDIRKHPTSQAGITCTVCHAITNINSTIGNADYTIEEPQHYPFAFSDNAVLQFINNQLVKAKPSFHKKTFLKPLHRSTEFCSTCHKVNLPYAVNHYKEFLRGQNHYDPSVLSGAMGGGARSFYYPEKAKTNCAECHMPLVPSDDFGARLFAGADKVSIHNHLFPAANTALPHMRGDHEIVKAHQEFLKGVMRVDIFGMREGGTVDGKLIAPLRPELPSLKPGSSYLLEAVVRTLKLGHPYTQGTVDSNETWLEVTVTSGGKVIGKNGGIDAEGSVDPWSHFLNVYMLDKDGNRIERRNPQDIFTPLYNHQIPPGAAQVGHYELTLPEDLAAPVTIEVKLQYRKFDKIYMDFVTRSWKPGQTPIAGFEPGKPYINDLPVTTLAVDRVTLPVEGVAAQVDEQKPAIAELWQRWNDYGIGLFIEGQVPGIGIGGKTELKQAEQAFQEVERLDRYDGPLNLARVYFTEGRLDEAVAALNRAADAKEPAAPPWTIAWLNGLVNRQQGNLDDAIENFRAVLYDNTDEMRKRNFDFSRDYEVRNNLGLAIFDRAKQFRGADQKADRERLLRDAVRQFELVLRLESEEHAADEKFRRKRTRPEGVPPTGDTEDVTAHYNLFELYEMLGESDKAEVHRALHLKYKADDNAQDRAVNLARKRSAAANLAAEKLVIYSLHREGAPGLGGLARPADGIGGGQ